MSYRTGRAANRAANLIFLRMTWLAEPKLVALRPLSPKGYSAAAFPRSTSEGWWSRTGSNRRPPACKAGALPAELRPLMVKLVGLGGLEPPTSRLSSARSNQLSYKPSCKSAISLLAQPRKAACPNSDRRGSCRAPVKKRKS